MTFKRYFVGAAAAAMMLPLSLSVAADNNAVKPTDSGSAMPAGAAMTPQEQTEHFFKQNASDNTLEIRLAQLAQERSTDEQVKKTAQMIQQDHQQANQLLQQIAQKNNITVNTDELTPVHQAIYDAMQKKQGDMFTRGYVFEQAGGHHTDALMLRCAINKGTPACKEYAEQVLPKVRHHLDEFDRIAESLIGSGTAQGSDLSGQARPAAGQVPANEPSLNGNGPSPSKKDTGGPNPPDQFNR